MQNVNVIKGETDLIKHKIIKIVAQYKKLFPDEYNALVSYLKEKRKINKDQFGTINGPNPLKATGALERVMFEIPVTLDNMLAVKLTTEENQWRKEKDYARWFQNKFKEFISSDKN